MKITASGIFNSSSKPSSSEVSSSELEHSELAFSQLEHSEPEPETLNPIDGYGHYCDRGQTRLGLERYEDAMACFNRAIALAPDRVEGWCGRGEALTGLSRYQEALQSFDQALQINPACGSAWVLQGIALICLRQYAEAVNSCDRALQLQDQEPETWIIRGIALQKLGRDREAEASYKQACKQDRKPFLVRLSQSIEETWTQLLVWVQAAETDIARDATLRRLYPPQQRTTSRRELSLGLSIVLLGTVMTLTILYSFQLTELESSGMALTQFSSTAAPWIPNRGACQSSGRSWKQGMCWEQPR